MFLEVHNMIKNANSLDLQGFTFEANKIYQKVDRIMGFLSNMDSYRVSSSLRGRIAESKNIYSAVNTNYDKLNKYYVIDDGSDSSYGDNVYLQGSRFNFDPYKAFRRLKELSGGGSIDEDMEFEPTDFLGAYSAQVEVIRNAANGMYEGDDGMALRGRDTIKLGDKEIHESLASLEVNDAKSILSNLGLSESNGEWIIASDKDSINNMESFPGMSYRDYVDLIYKYVHPDSNEESINSPSISSLEASDGDGSKSLLNEVKKRSGGIMYSAARRHSVVDGKYDNDLALEKYDYISGKSFTNFLQNSRKKGSYDYLDDMKSTSDAGDSKFEYFARGLKSTYNRHAMWYKEIDGYNAKVLHERFSTGDKSLFNSQFSYFDQIRRKVSDIEQKMEYIKGGGVPNINDKKYKVDGGEALYEADLKDHNYIKSLNGDVDQWAKDNLDFTKIENSPVDIKRESEKKAWYSPDYINHIGNSVFKEILQKKHGDRDDVDWVYSSCVNDPDLINRINSKDEKVRNQAIEEFETNEKTNYENCRDAFVAKLSGLGMLLKFSENDLKSEDKKPEVIKKEFLNYINKNNGKFDYNDPNIIEMLDQLTPDVRLKAHRKTGELALFDNGTSDTINNNARKKESIVNIFEMMSVDHNSNAIIEKLKAENLTSQDPAKIARNNKIISSEEDSKNESGIQKLKDMASSKFIQLASDMTKPVNIGMKTVDIENADSSTGSHLENISTEDEDGSTGNSWMDFLGVKINDEGDVEEGIETLSDMDADKAIPFLRSIMVEEPDSLPIFISAYITMYGEPLELKEFLKELHPEAAEKIDGINNDDLNVIDDTISAEDRMNLIISEHLIRTLGKSKGEGYSICQPSNLNLSNMNNLQYNLRYFKTMYDDYLGKDVEYYDEDSEEVVTHAMQSAKMKDSKQWTYSDLDKGSNGKNGLRGLISEWSSSASEKNISLLPPPGSFSEYSKRVEEETPRSVDILRNMISDDAFYEYIRVNLDQDIIDEGKEELAKIIGLSSAELTTAKSQFCTRKKEGYHNEGNVLKARNLSFAIYGCGMPQNSTIPLYQSNTIGSKKYIAIHNKIAKHYYPEYSGSRGDEDRITDIDMEDAFGYRILEKKEGALPKGTAVYGLEGQVPQDRMNSLSKAENSDFLISLAGRFFKQSGNPYNLGLYDDMDVHSTRISDDTAVAHRLMRFKSIIDATAVGAINSDFYASNLSRYYQAGSPALESQGEFGKFISGTGFRRDKGPNEAVEGYYTNEELDGDYFKQFTKIESSKTKLSNDRALFGNDNMDGQLAIFETYKTALAKAEGIFKSTGNKDEYLMNLDKAETQYECHMIEYKFHKDWQDDCLGIVGVNSEAKISELNISSNGVFSKKITMADFSNSAELFRSYKEHLASYSELDSPIGNSILKNASGFANIQPRDIDGGEVINDSYPVDIRNDKDFNIEYDNPEYEETKDEDGDGEDGKKSEYKAKTPGQEAIEQKKNLEKTKRQNKLKEEKSKEEGIPNNDATAVQRQREEEEAVRERMEKIKNMHGEGVSVEDYDKPLDYTVDKSDSSNPFEDDNTDEETTVDDIKPEKKYVGENIDKFINNMVKILHKEGPKPINSFKPQHIEIFKENDFVMDGVNVISGPDDGSNPTDIKPEKKYVGENIDKFINNMVKILHKEGPKPINSFKPQHIEIFKENDFVMDGINVISGPSGDSSKKHVGARVDTFISSARDMLAKGGPIALNSFLPWHIEIFRENNFKMDENYVYPDDGFETLDKPVKQNIQQQSVPQPKTAPSTVVNPEVNPSEGLESNASSVRTYKFRFSKSEIDKILERYGV
jgi:hypothetical protein